MTHIKAVPIIITHKALRVVLRNVLGVLLHEVCVKRISARNIINAACEERTLDGIPQRRDRRAPLVQRYREGVDLFLLLHVDEGVEGERAVEQDVGSAKGLGSHFLF